MSQFNTNQAKLAKARVPAGGAAGAKQGTDGRSFVDEAALEQILQEQEQMQIILDMQARAQDDSPASKGTEKAKTKKPKGSPEQRAGTELAWGKSGASGGQSGSDQPSSGSPGILKRPGHIVHLVPPREAILEQQELAATAEGDEEDEGSIDLGRSRQQTLRQHASILQLRRPPIPGSSQHPSPSPTQPTRQAQSFTLLPMTRQSPSRSPTDPSPIAGHRAESSRGPENTIGSSRGPTLASIQEGIMELGAAEQTGRGSRVFAPHVQLRSTSSAEREANLRSLRKGRQAVEAYVRARLRNPESNLTFQRTLRQHNQTLQDYRSRGSGAADPALAKAGRNRMYYHNHDRSNRHLQLLNVRSHAVECGLMEAGLPTAEGEEPIQRPSPRQSPGTRKPNLGQGSKAANRISGELSPSNLQAQQSRRLLGAASKDHLGNGRYFMVGSGEGMPGSALARPWSRADGDHSQSAHSGTQEAATSSHSSRREAAKAPPKEGQPMELQEVRAIDRYDEHEHEQEQEDEDQWDGRGSRRWLKQSSSQASREIRPHRKNMNEAFNESLFAEGTPNQIRRALLLGHPRDQDPPTPITAITQLLEQLKGSDPAAEAGETRKAGEAGDTPRVVKITRPRKRVREASPGVVRRGNNSIAACRILPQMIVALPKGVTNALTTTLRQKKSESTRQSPLMRGDQHISSFSRILGELQALPCRVSPRAPKAKKQQEPQRLIVRHADATGLQRVDTTEDTQEKSFPDGVKVLDGVRVLVAPEGRDAGLGLTGPPFAPSALGDQSAMMYAQERQSVLQHYAPSLSAWPGALLPEQIRSGLQKSTHSELLDSAPQSVQAVSQLKAMIEPVAISPRRYPQLLNIDAAGADSGMSQSQHSHPSQLSRAILRNDPPMAPKSFLTTDISPASPRTLEPSPAKSPSEQATFASSGAAVAMTLGGNLTAGRSPLSPGAMQTTKLGSPVASIQRGTMQSDGSRGVPIRDGPLKMTQTMTLLKPTAATSGTANCMQNLAFMAGNFNPGLTARPSDASAIERKGGFARVPMNTQANFDFQTMLGQFRPQPNVFNITQPGLATRRKEDHRTSEWTLSTHTDLPAIRQGGSSQRLEDSFVKRKRYSHQLTQDIKAELRLATQALTRDQLNETRNQLNQLQRRVSSLHNRNSLAFLDQRPSIIKSIVQQQKLTQTLTLSNTATPKKGFKQMQMQQYMNMNMMLTASRIPEEYYNIQDQY